MHYLLTNLLNRITMKFFDANRIISIKVQSNKYFISPI